MIAIALNVVAASLSVLRRALEGTVKNIVHDTLLATRWLCLRAPAVKRQVREGVPDGVDLARPGSRRDPKIPLRELLELENVKLGLAYVCKGFRSPPGRVRITDLELLMVLLALFGLAKHRKYWAKKPEATWGVFLNLLSSILTPKKSKAMRLHEAPAMLHEL